MAATATSDGRVDDMARKAAHDALGVQIYPGSEIMTDGTISIITARERIRRNNARWTNS